MSLSIKFPYDKLIEDPLEWDEETETFRFNEDKGIALWKIRNRAYFYGQEVARERVAFRDAYLSAQSLIHYDEDKGQPDDDFYENNFEVAFEKWSPLREYIRSVREKAKQRKRSNNGSD